MKGEWCYFKSYFSADECNSILEKSKDLSFKEATLGENGDTENSGHRRSRVAWILPDLFPELYDTLWKLEREANKDWFGFHVDSLEYIQIAEYDGNIKGEYKKHQDVFYINGSERHRKLSAVIQLSDPNQYEGGDLRFFDCLYYPDAQDIRQQGTVIFFPSFIYHQADPVTSGIRHSLAAWFEGPRWR
jgi:PKHD-type hydroxylase